jgi:hypothetical protein
MGLRQGAGITGPSRIKLTAAILKTPSLTPERQVAENRSFLVELDARRLLRGAPRPPAFTLATAIRLGAVGRGCDKQLPREVLRAQVEPEPAVAQSVLAKKKPKIME